MEYDGIALFSPSIYGVSIDIETITDHDDPESLQHKIHKASRT